MKPYPSYKESGVEWIGEIPSGWEVKRLGMMGIFTSSGIDKKTKEDEPSVKMVNYMDVYNDSSHLLDSSKDYMVVSCPATKVTEHQIKKGDLLFLPSSETQVDLGLSSLVDEKLPNTVFSYHLVRFQFTENIYHSFRKYLCNNHFVLNQFSRQGKGTTRQIIGRNVVRNIRVVLPPLPEQHQIASYLDAKTQLIDALIEKTEQKIELLKESVLGHLYECFFKKVNLIIRNNEWFQSLPEGWEAIPMKSFFDIVGIKNNENERLLSVTQDKGVIYRDEQETNVMNPSGDTSNYKLVEPGDFIISLRSSEGGFELSNVRGIVSTAYTVLKPKFEIDPIFYKYLFKSENFITELNRYIAGIRDGKNIYFEDIKNVSVPVKKWFKKTEVDLRILNHHKNIFDYFEFQNRRFRLLKEYRQSLISEVATGKIDVREEIVA